MLIAYASTETIARVAPPTIPRLNELALDWRVMTFAIVTSMLTALVCGCLPALELSRRPSADTLKDGGREWNGRQASEAAVRERSSRRSSPWPSAPGCRWTADSQLQPADGGRSRLSIRARDHARHEPAGASRIPYAQSIRAFYQRLLEQVESLPGVKASAASTDLPLSIREHRAFTIEISAAGVRVRPEVIAHHWVVGQYFEAMGITLRRGRFLSREDTGQSEPVVVINEALAKAFWADHDPVDSESHSAAHANTVHGCASSGSWLTSSRDRWEHRSFRRPILPGCRPPTDWWRTTWSESCAR